VSVDGKTYNIAMPFMVFATQNPVDFDGTFPLPESQMDRFLMRLQMGYPKYDKELEILYAGVTRYDNIQMTPSVSREDITALQNLVPTVYVEDSVLHYILQIITATREEQEFRAGVSTRGGLSLKLATQATALANGRNFVIPEDVTTIMFSVIAHRLSLRRQTGDTLEERRLIHELLEQIIETIPAPV